MARFRYVGPSTEGETLGHVEKTALPGETVDLDDKEDAAIIRGLAGNPNWEPVDEKRRAKNVTEGTDGDGA